MKIAMTDEFRKLIENDIEEKKVCLDIIKKVRSNRIIIRPEPISFVDVSWINDNNGMSFCKLSNNIRCF
jgi:hypothetical protein